MKINNVYKKNNIVNNIVNNKKGFTLLETLIAIFILTLSITGPVYIASIAFRNTIDSRDNISAQYLAEEVIEVLKNKRDTMSLGGTLINWPTFFDSTDINMCLNEKGNILKKCYMLKDITTQEYLFYKCTNDIDCPNMTFNASSTDVVYDAKDVNINSKFIREFYLEKNESDPNANNSVKVVVNILWNDKGKNKIYSLKERLYNLGYNQFFNNN